MVEAFQDSLQQDLENGVQNKIKYEWPQSHMSTIHSLGRGQEEKSKLLKEPNVQELGLINTNLPSAAP
jgi:hypothetical protein